MPREYGLGEEAADFKADEPLQHPETGQVQGEQAIIPRIGIAVAPENTPQNIGFEERDEQDSVDRVSGATVVRDYTNEYWFTDPESVKAYPSYIPVSDLSEPKLAGASSHDWKSAPREKQPPIKVLADESGLHILDGNNRLRDWRQEGYSHIPAWVIDARSVGKTDDYPLRVRSRPAENV